MEEEFTYFNEEWNPKILKFRGSNNLVKHSIILKTIKKDKDADKYTK